ncbi:MAG: Gfo/Idh/MocA family oxidoreductase [Candidatus Marinimicrobia bacterium]|nr:Gfo/Idh/MocA family oxidoreductase [Candidatus Neomarinimicrobiota bacterium]
MKKITAGVIGCGNISRFHFSGLAQAGARVKWVCDLQEAAARPWAERCGATWTADYRAVVQDPAVNTVVVTTPSRFHKEVCLAAIAAGKAVICEKTLAENPADALAIVRAAERKKTIFYTSYMKRFIPAVEQAKALLPELGPILSTHIRAHQPWGDLWTQAPTEGFFHKPRRGPSPLVASYGGGILVCGGSHILDLVCFFLGRPRRLYAALEIPKGRDYDLRAVALLETDHGPVHYEALAHPLKTVGFLRDGWDERIEINGVHGRLEVFSALWDQPEHKTSLLVHTDNRTGRAVEYRGAPVSPFDRALVFFCDNIRRGIQGAQDRRTGYDVDELIAHLKRSAQTHQAVDVKWKR